MGSPEECKHGMDHRVEVCEDCLTEKYKDEIKRLKEDGVKVFIENVCLKAHLDTSESAYRGSVARYEELVKKTAMFREALKEIVAHGRTCPEFETCNHDSCKDSYAACAIAYAVLRKYP